MSMPDAAVLERGRYRYRLREHVHACFAGDYFVLLDLKADEYVGLSGPGAHCLREWICDWPVSIAHKSVTNTSPANESQDAESQNAHVLLDNLMKRGLLTTSPTTQPTATPPLIQRSSRALIDGYCDLQPSIGPKEVFRFLRAVITIRLSLRLGSLYHMVTICQRRSHATRMTRGDSVRNDVYYDRARLLVASYQTLKPILFTSRGACLEESFALKYFLSLYGFHPSCVIGVATHPFSAHCWVQEDDIVFNDDPCHVNGFTPIFVA